MSESLLWPEVCVDELLVAVRAMSVPHIGEWIRAHVLEDDRWDDYAALLTFLSAAYLQNDIEQQLGRPIGKLRGFVGFMPEVGDASGGERDAAVIVTLAMNDDYAGVRGLIAAAREAGQIDDLCGHLALIACRAAQGVPVPMRLEKLS